MFVKVLGNGYLTITQEGDVGTWKLALKIAMIK